MEWESGILPRETVQVRRPIVPAERIWTVDPFEGLPVEQKQETPLSHQAEPLQQTQPGFRKMVFVAEDDDDMREAVATALRAGQYRVKEARDGAELLDLLLDALDVPLLRPHVVVADVRMPKLSGLGVLATLRRASRAIPVLLITALTDESVLTVARRLGAIGVLRKPFDMKDLLTAVLNAGTSRGRGPAS
jgi:CheY-like chemotaxis protein